MAIRGLSLNDTAEYQCDVDPDKGTPDATVWIIGTLSSRVIAYINDNVTEFSPNQDGDEVSATAVISSNKMAVERCRFGLRGWRNLLDCDGGQIEFKSEKAHIGRFWEQAVPYNLLDKIPLEVLLELSERVRKQNVVEDQEAKNSG